jgi:hypothetical protein
MLLNRKQKQNGPNTNSYLDDAESVETQLLEINGESPISIDKDKTKTFITEMTVIKFFLGDLNNKIKVIQDYSRFIFKCQRINDNSLRITCCPA